MNLQSEKTASPPRLHLLSFENKRVDLNVIFCLIFLILNCLTCSSLSTVTWKITVWMWAHICTIFDGFFVKPVITFHKDTFFLSFFFFTGIQHKNWIIWFRSFWNIDLKLSVNATFYHTYISCYMTHYVLREALQCILGMDNFKH